MLRKKKFIVGGTILVLALAALLFNAFRGGSYYYTISEVKTATSAVSQQRVRVMGNVVPGSVNWSAQNFTADFTLSDKDTQESLAVVYTGALPDNFKEGTDVIVEGSYIPGQPFRADKIEGKCASKYAPA